MNLENASQKQLNDIEMQVRQLLVSMSRAKLGDDPLIEALKKLENDLGEMRRVRFDESNPEYNY